VPRGTCPLRRADPGAGSRLAKRGLGLQETWRRHMNRHTAARFQADIEKPIAMLACAVNSLPWSAFRLPEAGEKKTRPKPRSSLETLRWRVTSRTS